MDVQGIHERLTSRFASAILGSDLAACDPWVEVAPERLVEICTFLHDEADLQFAMLNCVSGVDYFEPDAKKAATVPWQPHLEVLYHVSSLVHKHRLVLKVTLPRWKDSVEGQVPEIETVSSVWRTADWHEREVFDLMGVRFLGHPDLRRILMPEDWVGHPLRKDYQAPEQYHGISRSEADVT